MKPAVQIIFQYVLDHPEMTTKIAVDSCFDQFLFSLEKQEWDGLTDQEKQQFANQVDLKNGRHPRENNRGQTEMFGTDNGLHQHENRGLTL